MSKALIIVESPAKARTISKYLGKDYVVESSIGHIRDLPSRADEIPAAYKGKPWARTGVDVENDFKPLYIVPAEKKQQVKKLKDLLDKASELFLATDEDREGEAIAWHLKEVLKPTVPVKRMVFHEITQRAIEQALANPRALDERLVDAQEARRILDRLYGYEVSPILWRKVRPRLSAGRVQSVATRLIVERERQRMAFKAADYWSVSADLDSSKAKGNTSEVKVELVELGGRRIALGRDFDGTTGRFTDTAKRDRVLLLDEQGAKALEQDLVGKPFEVAEVTSKPFTQRPAPPFITSTLQQEAGRKLRYTAQRAMRVAQRLYENGYITYMRTDSTTLSQEAISAARKQVTELYGADYLPPEPRTYATKAKGAQEAHEAIRPAGETFRTPEQVKSELDEDAFRLYELIWKRTMASQMKDATGQRTQIRFAIEPTAQGEVDGTRLASRAVFTASGKVITFPGFLRAYVEGSDDPEQELEEKEKILPDLKVGEQLPAKAAESASHRTQPPARFTEASLVKELEERGIGRPSTYASIIQTIQDRGYVWKKGGALVPTFTAFAVTNLLEKHFSELVDYEFTARMEGDLDAISHGDKKPIPYLTQFYFGKNGKDEGAAKPDGKGALPDVGLKVKIGSGVEDIDPREICTLPLGTTQSGELIAARVGRYGPYLQVGDSDRRANLPEEVAPDELDAHKALEILEQADQANRPLGTDPETNKPVYVKTGRYGPYVQLGDPELTPKGNIKKGSKPKMASLFPGMSPGSLTLEEALFLLSFPKVLGKHPDTGADVVVQDGQFGPYVSMEVDGKRETRSLEGHAQLVSITLDEAVELLRQPKARGRQRAQQGPIATLGTSSVTSNPIEVRTGRFGPYVTDGEVNATIPSTRDPAKISLDDALELIAQREERMRAQGKDPRPKKKAAPERKAAAKKTATAATKKAAPKKKAATKKAATKKAATSAKKTTTKKRASR